MIGYTHHYSFDKLKQGLYVIDWNKLRLKPSKGTCMIGKLDLYVLEAGEVSSIFTFSSRFAKKSWSKRTPPKKSSPTNHATETCFLHVLDPPTHFGTIYIFNHFFAHIHNLDSFFFNESAAECEYAANFIDVN